jgi:hypothetical protein
MTYSNKRTWMAIALSVGLALVGVGLSGCGSDDPPPISDDPGITTQAIPPAQATQSDQSFVEYLLTLDTDNETDEPAPLAATELPGDETSEPASI